jgi:pimeloyl-ACP methyl ester carboxylesterase
MSKNFAVVQAVVLMGLVSVQAFAQAPPPAYFEATGTYQTHWAGLFGTGTWDCTGCSEAPPWSAVSGSGVSLNGPGRAISVSLGTSNATATFQGSYGVSNDAENDPYGAQYSRLQGGSIAVYVLGPPGTPFRLQYSYSEFVHAFKASDEACGNYAGASFGAQFLGLVNQNVTAGQVGDNAQHTASNSVTVEGLTTTQTRSYHGQLYSRAWLYAFSAGAVMNFKCDHNLTGAGEFAGTITISVNSTSDSDGDGIPDDEDDSDGDGVTDDRDRCSNTPLGTPVDANGCPFIHVTLVDPVPDLLTAIKNTDRNSLLNGGRTVDGVAADGVAQLLIRVTGAQANDTLQLELDQDGGLADLGSTSFQSAVTINADSQGNAFALYRAPLDFARLGGGDDAKQSRTVHLTVTPASAVSSSTGTPILIVRPPVILVHGTWGNAAKWLHFGALNPLNPDPRFHVFPIDYSGVELQGVTVIAASVMDQIRNNTTRFKNLLHVASVQSDLVAYSLGGLVSRALALTPAFIRDENFAAGDVHKLITLDATHSGTPLATNLIASNFLCKWLWGVGGRPIGQQIEDQATNSQVLLKLNSALAHVHLRAHALAAAADPIQMSDAEDSPATQNIIDVCRSLLPGSVGSKFRTLFTTADNPNGDNDIIVGLASQQAHFSAVSSPIPRTTFQILIHTVGSLSPTGPDVLNRMLDAQNQVVDAVPTVPTIAEVIRLLNSSITSADFAPIKP